MLVSLYTVRVVLETLGTEDYGIYNVVGGVVVLFTFLNSAMTSATQRFLNFAMGQNDTEQVRDIYSASLVIHAAIAVAVVVLAETAGLWFFYTWLNIPSERQEAAFAVYQFSVAATVIGILQVPYRATIIAYEKMSFFAILSIVEAVLKLGVVFLLPVIPFDNLAVYAFLLFVTGIIVLFMHKLYCNKNFEPAHFKHCKENGLFRQLLGFSSWTVFSRIAGLGMNQGINILMNIFRGVTMNAAMGITMQVNSAVYQFVGNFQTAFNPQIVKSYSAKDYDGLMNLVFLTSKVSFCLILIFALPLCINADFVLRIWLGSVPEYTVQFTQLILLSSLVSAIDGPLWMSVLATGNIRKNEVITSCFTLANLPLVLLFLFIGFSPVWILVIRVVLSVLTLVWRISFLKSKIEFPVSLFYRKTIVPLAVITVLSVFLVAFSQNLFIADWNRLIASCFTSIVSITCLMYCIGLDRQEKKMLQKWIKLKAKGDSDYPIQGKGRK